MKKYDGYLIDLDGTMYLGNQRIPDAVAFVNELKRQKKSFLFITNNSTKTPQQIVAKLQSFDIDVTEEQILTSAIASARVIANANPTNGVYVIGEEGLFQALKEHHISFSDTNPDIVVIGLDRHVTFEKLTKGAVAIQNGARFISTNMDYAIPKENYFIPGNGAITTALIKATGCEPHIIGKPNKDIMEQALQRIGVKRERVLMVGDNYKTDIMSGMHAGVDTLLVHTGVTSESELKQYDLQPTYSIKSLQEWIIY